MHVSRRRRPESDPRATIWRMFARLCANLVSRWAEKRPFRWHGTCNDYAIHSDNVGPEIAMTDQLTTTIPPNAAPAAEVHLSGDVFGALINLSGRRRFTSQRVVLYAVLASMGHEGAVATARETLALFRDAHTSLIDGKGNVPGIFCGQLRDAYFGTLQGDKVIRNFIKLAEQTLDGIVGNGRAAPVLLDELVRSATPLLSVLNGLTLVYEEQSKRHALAQKRQLQEMMGDIKTIARQARMVAFNAQIVAARAGPVGREFAVVASTMSSVTSEIDELVHKALSSSLGH
jgi:hypothetical protein